MIFLNNQHISATRITERKYFIYFCIWNEGHNETHSSTGTGSVCGFYSKGFTATAMKITRQLQLEALEEVKAAIHAVPFHQDI